MHVAIIMDGNGRWATSRGLPRIVGHRAGVAAVRRVVERARTWVLVGLRSSLSPAITGAVPLSRCGASFGCCARSCAETERLRQRGVRVQIIGRRDRLADSVLREIDKAECATASGRDLHLRVAIDYSSRDAITPRSCQCECCSLRRGISRS